MSRNYQPWTPSEEAHLEAWVARHPELTWEEKANKYALDNQPVRTAESLRSKLAQLDRGIRRHRPIRKQLSKLRNTTRRNRQQGAAGASTPIRVPTPPVLAQRTRNLWIQSVLQREQSPVSRQHHPAYTIPRALTPERTAVATFRDAERKPCNCQSFKDRVRHKTFRETHGKLKTIHRSLEKPSC
jgi:hypothetical protein